MANDNHLYQRKTQLKKKNKNFALDAGKSLSEAHIFASTNPQYDDILFIELQVQYMKIVNPTCQEHVVYTNCFLFFVLTFGTIYAHNMFLTCSELAIFMY